MCITENMTFTTQQLRSYALTCCEFQSLECDELFVSTRAFSRLNTSSSADSCINVLSKPRLTLFTAIRSTRLQV